MATLDIIQSVARYESGDTRQFQMANSATVASTATFAIYDFSGATVALNSVQSGATVTQSPTGIFFINRVLPSSTGIYTWEWTLWDSSSRPYYTRNEFEIINSLPTSFFTYCDVQDTIRTARNFFGRTNITIREMQPVCQAADGYIDSYLGRVMNVPLTPPVPPLIADMSKVYTLWRFSSDRHFFELNEEDSAVVRRKNDYDKLLQSIAAGSLTVVNVGSSSITITSDQDDVVAIPDPTYKAVFDMRDWIDQRVDPDLVDDEDSKDV